MKRATAFLVAICILGLFLDAPSVPSSYEPSYVMAVQTVPARAIVEHLSSTRTSLGTTQVYCVVQNVGPTPMTKLSARVALMDSLGAAVEVKDIILFDGDTLRPQGKAIFNISFEECWDCTTVKVALY